MDKVRDALALLGASYQAFFLDDAPRLAAALAFYALLSAAPLLIVAVGVASIVFNQDTVRLDVLEFIETTVGPSGREVLATLFENAYDAYQPRAGVLASIIGGALLLVGSSGVFAQLNASIAKIWNTEERVRGGIMVAVMERVRGIGMVLVVGLLLIASLATTTALTTFQEFLVRSTNLSEVGLEILNLGLNLVVVALFFALVYRAMPATDATWRDVWPGAIVAAPLFALGNFGLSFYLGTSAVGSAFGAAGSLVVFLFWIYFAGLVFFFGAEVSSVYAVRRAAAREETAEGGETAEGTAEGADEDTDVSSTH